MEKEKKKKRAILFFEFLRVSQRFTFPPLLCSSWGRWPHTFYFALFAGMELARPWVMEIKKSLVSILFGENALLFFVFEQFAPSLLPEMKKKYTLDFA